MIREQFIEKLTEAGNKFDGHVTNGSVTAMMEIIEEIGGPFSRGREAGIAASEEVPGTIE